MSDFIYRTIGVGSPFWKTEPGKKLLTILRITVLIICYAILGWAIYWVLVGFSQTSPNPDWIPGETYPY